MKIVNEFSLTPLCRLEINCNGFSYIFNLKNKTILPHAKMHFSRYETITYFIKSIISIKSNNQSYYDYCYLLIFGFRILKTESKIDN